VVIESRLEGWEIRLDSMVERLRHAPYAIGSNDCFRLACRAIEALTGVDRWPEFAGYTTKREALRRIAVHGASFEAAGDWFFGPPRRAPACARRGDIVALRTTDGTKHLGVCMGHRAALISHQGLLFVPIERCLCSWGVGW